ncbi:MAG: hypothetical protein MHPSP_003553, partial [Paramarteilia canceri]
MISLLAILNEVLNVKMNVILIEPYVALAKEKIRHFSAYAVEYDFLIEEYAAGRGLLPPKQRKSKKVLYVATIEKGCLLIESLIDSNRLNEISLIIIDE